MISDETKTNSLEKNAMKKKIKSIQDQDNHT